MGKLEPWKLVESKPIADYRIFKIRSDLKISPRTQKPYEFIIIETVSWVNVVATTPNDELVMIEQYRHGSNTVELEIPGGMMDATDPGVVHTGVRELEEETGFRGENAQLIGSIQSNPAILNNKTFTVLVENCRPASGITLDPGEDLETILVPIPQIPELIRSGRIGHSLVVVALYHFELWRRKALG
jgi:8-oxo-dGTP pyrophosphatase MutT (NUDIX family)